MQLAPPRHAVTYQNATDTFLFIWTDETRRQMFSFPGHYAACEDINLTWFEAAAISEKIRNTNEPLCDVVAIGERTNG